MSQSDSKSRPVILFVTGRLSETSLRSVVGPLSEQLDFEFEVAVPGIQVAALLHTGLLLKRLSISSRVDRVILPGWCQGDVSELERHFGKRFELGPKDLFDLPEYFGVGARKKVDLSSRSIEIIAEINHATRLSIPDAVAQALAYSADGADVIDVGCIPGESSPVVRQLVAALRSEGLRVSIDSFDRSEVEQAVEAGAELILSCNEANVDWVSRLGAEVVAIPETPADSASLDRLIERLKQDSVRFRVDPILEPIGMGFTASLERYLDVRRRYPDVPMMMGIGNVTELTEVDSAGVNVLLAAICEELEIQSVLTTEVINWCRTAVAEFSIARRLVHYAVKARTIPKHLDSSLVILRDPILRGPDAQALSAMAAVLTDANYRIHVADGQVHLMNCHGHWTGSDVFALFESALAAARPVPKQRPGSAIAELPAGVTANHAFYLGYELARAELALHLGKNYTQDEPLRFGLLGDWKASSSVAAHRSESADPS